MKVAPLFGLLFAASLAIAQQPTPSEALRAAPKQFSVSDIPDNYRAVGLGGNDWTSMYMLGMRSGAAGGDLSKQNLLVSLFRASWVDPDEFQAALEGKVSRFRVLVLDLGSMGLSGPDPIPVFAESWVEASHLLSWTPLPNLKKAELVKSFGSDVVGGNIRGDQTQALSNAKQIALGVIMYAQDYDDFLPATNSTSETAGKVQPYLKNNSLWTTKNPLGGRVLYNVSLSKVSMTAIELPAETLLLWEEKAWPDGRRAVAYTDGHAKLLTADQWTQAWSAEQIRRQQRPRAQFVRPRNTVEATLIQKAASAGSKPHPL